VAHNGVLPGVVRPGKGDARSDTRIAAEDFLPAFGSLRTRRARARLERWMTPDNKMVILTVDRRFRQQSFILNEDAGLWDRGIWYSNDGYLLPPRPRWAQDAGQDWGWRPDGAAELVDRCGYCRADINVDDDECRQCGGCPRCGELLQHCWCYMPAAQHHELGSSRGRSEAQTDPEPPVTNDMPAGRIDKSTMSAASSASARLSRRTAHA
jgi:glutamine amidotransferase